MQNKDLIGFRRKGDLGIPFVVALFLLAAIIGTLVFRSYEKSSREISVSLTEMQKLGEHLTIDACAEKTMDWFNHCDAMTQLCDTTVSRMIKVCLLNGQKAEQCSRYGNDIYSYNFGVKKCMPYMHEKSLKRQKKACADIWQTVSTFCKIENKVTKQNSQ